MKKPLAVIALNNCNIVDRTYSKLITGINSLKGIEAAYRGVNPVYFNDTNAVPVTPDITTLIGQALVNANDLVYIFSIVETQNNLFTNKGHIDLAGFIIRESYSNFRQAPEHSVVLAVGTTTTGGRVDELRHDTVVTPVGGVNSVTEYIIANVQPSQYAPSQQNTVQGGLTYPTYGQFTKGQEGIVMPFPMAADGASQPGALKWQAVIFKNCNLPDIRITVTPIVVHTLAKQSFDQLVAVSEN